MNLSEKGAGWLLSLGMLSIPTAYATGLRGWWLVASPFLVIMGYIVLMVLAVVAGGLWACFEYGRAAMLVSMYPAPKSSREPYMDTTHASPAAPRRRSGKYPTGLN